MEGPKVTINTLSFGTQPTSLTDNIYKAPNYTSTTSTSFGHEEVTKAIGQSLLGGITNNQKVTVDAKTNAELAKAMAKLVNDSIKTANLDGTYEAAVGSSVPNEGGTWTISAGLLVAHVVTKKSPAKIVTYPRDTTDKWVEVAISAPSY